MYGIFFRNVNETFGYHCFQKNISSVNKNQIYKQQYIVVVIYELIIDYADRVSDFLLN